MRKFLISAVVAASAFAVATPAAAQIHLPQGYHANTGQARNLVARIDQIRRQIDRLDSRDRISEREANSLRSEARVVRDQVRRSSYNGLNRRERQVFEHKVARLEQRVQREVRDGNRWGSNDGRYTNVGWDRDRDGRDDRYEDDRGRDHD